VLNFLNEGGEIRLCEADARRRDTVVLDIGRNVFVMRIRAGQRRDMRMFKWVIPGNFFASPVDFIAIVTDAPRLEVNEFPDIQDYVACEGKLSFEFGQGLTNGC